MIGPEDDGRWEKSEVLARTDRAPKDIHRNVETSMRLRYA